MNGKAKVVLCILSVSLAACFLLLIGSLTKKQDLSTEYDNSIERIEELTAEANYLKFQLANANNSTSASSEFLQQKAAERAALIDKEYGADAYGGSGQTQYVYVTMDGEKYHYKFDCSNMQNPAVLTMQNATAIGYTACSICCQN